MQAGLGLDIGVRKGDVIDAKYRVERIIGSGGMGVVVAARHLQLDELVAIKLLLPDALADADAVRRFEREARAAVKIKSEHVARILDVGRLDGGAPFIVMEYLRGEDLAARVTRTGPLAIEEAIELILQACEAMAEAHALGIVHRDLKPANLFRVHGADGRSFVKVLDFGISKFTHAIGTNSGFGMTKTSAVVGSPFYMSPEQMQSPRSVDARTDIWSIGIVLYQVLTGEVPFEGETLPQICVNVATRPAPGLRRFRSEIPAALEAVVLKCLEKDPEKRYPSVAALATALAKFAPRRAHASVERIMRTTRIASFHVSELAGARREGTSDRPVTGPTQRAAHPHHADRGTARSSLAGVATVGILLGSAVGLVWAVREPAASVTSPGTVLVNPVASAPTRRHTASPSPNLSPPAATASSASPVSRSSADVGKLDGRTPLTAAPGGAPAEPVAPAAPPGTGATNTKGPASPRSNPIRSSAEESTLLTETEAPAAAAERAGAGAERDQANADPADATCIFNFNTIPASEVVVDGVSLGFTPKRGVTIAAGNHSILFTSQDGDKRMTNASCSPGETKTISGRLSELPAADDLPAGNPYR